MELLRMSTSEETGDAQRRPTVSKRRPQAARRAKSDTDVSNTLLDGTPLLDNEDEALYMHILKEVFAELQPETFLDKIDAKDIADKIFEERRYKAAVADLIDGARTSAKSALFESDDDRESARSRDIYRVC
jgi:hypothetical protein